LFQVSKDLIVTTLNSLFNEKFDVDSIEVVKTETEIVTDSLDILRADINIQITEYKPKHYHVEIQTEIDGDMGFRSFRYNILKAMENYVTGGNKSGRATMPKSLIIQIKSGKNLSPNYGRFELEMADGNVIKYSAPVLKYSDYDKDKLLQKSLYILLPLQVFMLRDELDRMTKHGEPQTIQKAILKAKTLTETLISEVNKLHKEGKLSLFDTEKILIALKELFGHLNDRYNKINREELNREVDIMVRTFITEQAEQDKQQTLASKLKAKDIELAQKMFTKNMSLQEIIEFTTELTETELKDIQKTIFKKSN
jgi:hypothetical protein